MNVLLATDGKAHSAKAVDFAFNYAKLNNARLFIVFVASPRDDEDKEKVFKFGGSVLDDLKERGEREGVNVTTILEGGSPYETILASADRIKADLIVVGTSGKTIIDRVLIGSVSEYVVRNARSTVVVVR